MTAPTPTSVRLTTNSTTRVTNSSDVYGRSVLAAGSVRLRVGVSNLVTADTVELGLNGKFLATQTSARTPLGDHVPYNGQWIEVDLESVRPLQGENELSFALASRPDGLVSRDDQCPAADPSADVHGVMAFADLRLRSREC